MTTMSNRKVVWSEGMLVGPHHFQQWDRYYEALLNFRLQRFTPFNWGLIKPLGLTLQNGVLQLTAFHGILRTGTVVDIPDNDEAPPGREVEPHHFSGGNKPLDVYLTLPLSRQTTFMNQANGKPTPVSDARYWRDPVLVQDENNGQNEREIILAKKNLKIRFGTEARENVESIKIARLLRDSNGRIALDETFIPACLTLSASAALLSQLQSLYHHLVTKSKELASTCSRLSPQRFDFRDAEPETLWLLGLLNGSIATLTHLLTEGQAHPHQLFQHCLQLVGQLSTVATTIDAWELPLYDHDNPGVALAQLMQSSQQILDLIETPPLPVITSMELMEIESARGYPIFAPSQSIDLRLLAEHEQLCLVLRARASVPSELPDLLRKMTRVTIIASAERIDDYVEFAYCSRLASTSPPQGVQLGVDKFYYAVDESDERWEAIRASGSLAIHVPEAFRRNFDLFEIDLLAVQ